MERFSMYQTISVSLIHKRKHQINQRYREKRYVDKKNFDKSIIRTRDQKLTENKHKNHYDLLVPENILSARRRKELRILICFNPRNRNSVHRNIAFGMGTLDDMNHLKNKRIRSVADLLQDQFGLALVRLENMVKGTICGAIRHKLIPTPQNLVTSTPLKKKDQTKIPSVKM